MADRALFVRKATTGADPMKRSWPVALTNSLRFGRGEVAKVPGGTLAARTDAAGNIQPYEPDDPEVCRRLFGIEVGD